MRWSFCAVGIAAALATLASAQPTSRPVGGLPTADLPAHAAGEYYHPVMQYFVSAFSRRVDALQACDRAGAESALADMRYAVTQLRIRMKNARGAGAFSTVDARDLASTLERAELVLKDTEKRNVTSRCEPDQPAVAAPAPDASVAGVGSAVSPQLSLAGDWSGDNWGHVVIRGTAGNYEGTYTGTFGSGLGRFDFRRTAPDTWTGRWYDPDDVHFGEFTLRTEPGKAATLVVTWRSTDQWPRGGTSTWTRK